MSLYLARLYLMALATLVLSHTETFVSSPPEKSRWKPEPWVKISALLNFCLPLSVSLSPVRRTFLLYREGAAIPCKGLYKATTRIIPLVFLISPWRHVLPRFTVDLGFNFGKK